MNIFEQLRSGADVDMATPEYAEAIKHMTDCANICFKINTTAPLPEQIRPLEEQLFGGNLDKTSYLMPPIQIDFACQMKIGKGVFVNHSLTCRQPRLRKPHGAALQTCSYRAQFLDWRRCHHLARRYYRRECCCSCRCSCYQRCGTKYHRGW